jgi:ABC-2 type transport system permease protein
MAFIQLFIANMKMIYRNWRGMFWVIVLPLGLYIGLSLLKIKPSGPIKIDYSTYLLPGLIAFTIAQTGIFSLAYWLVDIRQRGVLRRFMVAPISNFQLLSSLMSTRLVLMIIQVILLAIIGAHYFNVHINGSVITVFILCILGGSIFLSIGFLISTISKTYEEAAPITTIVNFVFAFMGNIFFPVESLPKIFRIIGEKLPISYLADGLRINYVQDVGISASLPDIFGLVIWLIILFSLAIYMFQLTKED